eukprot:CAMPEP_0196822258 /NCGR_PEP_ID=MMETSP1362-20130617/82765_1 /TAXON_ID=163516 /ORGANISM="Leptocylindrus danicus, Strain CCMP1856" /LENGTH=43 /DNA_ID= /DNA_START= /DNA_END= /DNA_ORIENTATION=
MASRIIQHPTSDQGNDEEVFAPPKIYATIHCNNVWFDDVPMMI